MRAQIQAPDRGHVARCSLQAARCYTAAMMFKAVGYVAAGLVLGFALGGIPVRRELAAVREERDVLQAKLDHASRPNLLQAFLPSLGDPREPDDLDRSASGASRRATVDAAPAPGNAPSLDARPEARGDVVVIGSAERAAGNATSSHQPSIGHMAPVGQAAAEGGTADATDSPQREGGRRGGRELLGRFDQLISVQRARSAAARSALIEQAGIDGEQLARFDSAVTRMNGKLAGYGEEVIAQAASDDPPAPAQALGLGHDVSGILYEGQKELDAVVGEQGEGIDASALEIWNYVDLEQWRPYVESQLAGQRSDERSAPSGDGAAGAAATVPASPPE
jgi:hypothetical protein